LGSLSSPQQNSNVLKKYFKKFEVKKISFDLAAILDSLSSPQQNSKVLKIFKKNSRKKNSVLGKIHRIRKIPR
jgi:hypothetical protein